MVTKRTVSFNKRAHRHVLPGLLTALTLAATACATHQNKPAPDRNNASESDYKPVSTVGKASGETRPETVRQKNARAPVVRDNAPKEYVVKEGDTLWDIAGYFLKDPWQWPEIWHANPDIANPHLIYPGDKLYLSYAADGRPEVRLRPGAVRLQPQVRREPLSEAIPTIPVSAIRPFLKGPRVVSRKTLQDAGYIVAFADNRILAYQGDTAYAAHLGKHPHSQYQAVHPGEAYVNPKNGNTLGYKATPTALAKLVSPGKKGEAATLELTKSFQETAIGDRLLPTQESSLRTGYSPHTPDKPVNGQVIAAFRKMNEIGRYQVVALNLGSADGVGPGTVLNIFRPGGQVADPHGKERAATVQLPELKTGVLMVFKASDHLSHALVMKATQAIHVHDLVHGPDSDS